jgi:hypothetical protein
MRQRSKTTIHDLRAAIDCLPRDTRVAMLHGIRTNPIIAGAYTDGDGICPMLAAHRAGGRTSFISFAKAWDRFAFRDAKVPCARRATERELLVLRTHLEASLLADDAPDADLGAAMAEHRALVERRAAGAVRTAERPGDRDRSRELRKRSGWRWMRIVRSYDEYERVLEQLDAEHRALRERAPLPGPRELDRV